VFGDGFIVSLLCLNICSR